MIMTSSRYCNKVTDDESRTIAIVAHDIAATVTMAMTVTVIVIVIVTARHDREVLPHSMI